MPLRMMTGAFLYITGKSVKAQVPEGLAFDLGFFTCYQDVNLFFVHFLGCFVVRMRPRARGKSLKMPAAMGCLGHISLKSDGGTTVPPFFV